METAPSSGVFAVSEMIIKIEDEPDITTYCSSESHQPDVILCPSLTEGLENCQDQEDAGIDSITIKEEDSDIVFEECAVPMDTENFEHNEQELNILSDPLEPNKTLKKMSVSKTSSLKITKPGNLINCKKNDKVLRNGLNIQNLDSGNLEQMNGSTHVERSDILNQITNSAKRTRKPTQKMAEYICRLCEQHSYKLTKIFGFRGNQLKLADMIHFHLPVQVKASDKLPQGVCTSCINALNVCNDLYQKSLSTDCSLRKIFLNESQTKLQLIDNLQPKNTSKTSNRIPEANKNSGENEIEMEVVDNQSRSADGPKSSKGKKKAGSSTKVVESANATQSKGKNENYELSKKSGNSDALVECDAASVSSAEEEGNLWDQDDGEEDCPDDSTSVTCDLCPEVFPNRSELAKHRKTHPPEERLKCSDCGKIMPNDGSYHTHRKIHTSEPIPCHICGRLLASKSGLRNHLLVHEDPKYCCQICGKTFRTPAKLQSHLSSHSDERPFACEVCGQTFKLKVTLRQHSLTHNSRRRYVCDICGHSVNRRSHLKLHMATHQHREQKGRKLVFNHSCSQCTTKFRSMRALMEHRVAAHGEDEQSIMNSEYPSGLECNTCNQKFFSLYGYATHVKSCAKAYPCTFCERVLATQRSLENHLRGHTGERPFSCKFCDKMFKSEPSRDSHERIHTGERPYKCQKCDKAFRSITNLYQHKLIHEGERKYSCPHCKYKTHRAAALRIHLRVHTGEKPYTCELCGKSYKASWDLKLHSEIHNPSGTRTKRVRQKNKSKTQNLAFTETSESGDSTGVLNENPAILSLPELL